MADEKNDNPSSSEPESPPHATTLEDARKFLNDEKVQSESDEKKAEFLKSKGCTDEDIESLLKEHSASSVPVAHDETEQRQAQPEAVVIPNEVRTETASQRNTSQPTASSSNDTPPIITYPEFLTQSQKPPPLFTPSRLANGATVLATGWTIAYGIARFIVNPMVVTQSEARSEYYQHTSEKLTTLNEKLESMVSQVPYKDSRRLTPEGEIDDTSSDGDPTELFHRDIGTQTSTQDLLGSGSDHSAVVKPVDKQAESLSRLSAAAKEMSDMYLKRAEDTTALFSELREFREEIDKLAYPSESLSYGGGSGFGIGRSSEPDDEYKKCKDAIRSVKGMFLSARNFPPAGAAR